MEKMKKREIPQGSGAQDSVDSTDLPVYSIKIMRERPSKAFTFFCHTLIPEIV